MTNQTVTELARGRSRPITMDHALLGFLHLRPMHGYELYRRLSEPEGLGLVWKVKQSHLYALLARLEAERLIIADLQPQPNRPARRVFRLTRAGRQAYRTWVRSPVSRPRSMRQEYLVKLYFASLEGEGIATALLESQKDACREWLRVQQESPGQQRESQAFPAFVRSFRLAQLEAILGWLDRCEQSLPAIQPRTRNRVPHADSLKPLRTK